MTLWIFFLVFAAAIVLVQLGSLTVWVAVNIRAQ